MSEADDDTDWSDHGSYMDIEEPMDAYDTDSQSISSGISESEMQELMEFYDVVDSDNIPYSTGAESETGSDEHPEEILDLVLTQAMENQQPTGSITTQHSESVITQPPTELAATQPPTELAATQPPTELAATQPFTESSKTIDDDDPFSCPICLEGLTNTGLHRPACLKCGHIFGENCVQRWLKVACARDARRCPTCNAKATPKDIRVLYAKKLVAIDTAQLTALEVKLTEERRLSNMLKTDLDRFHVQQENLRSEVQRLKAIVDSVQSGLSSTCGHTSNRSCLKKINLGKNPGCRVLAFNRSKMLLVTSQHCESPLFPSHIIRKINASILEPSKECIYAHKKQIRDMVFHPIEHNLLASVGLDKCVNLIDFTSNNVVSSIEVGEALWSCCWAGNNSNVLIAGGQSGSLFYIDKRYMKLLDSQFLRKPACASLVSLPPSSMRSFINGGFLKTRLDCMSVFEQSNDSASYKESELPLKGFWTSTSYDSHSNLMLSSSKPCGNNKSMRHIVSKISNFNEEGPSIQPVVTFYGGAKATLLSRSCMVPSNQPSNDTLVCCNDESSSTVKLFNVNSGANVHNFSVNEIILDLCPLEGMVMNGSRVVAGLSENALSIFSV